MKAPLVALAWLLSACQAPRHPDPPETAKCAERVAGDPYELAAEKCAEHMTYCVEDGRVFDKRATCGLMVTWSAEACAEDLHLCGFVFFHEEGHARKLDEDEADCFAVRESLRLGYPEYIEAARCAVNLPGSGVDAARAARIARCAR